MQEHNIESLHKCLGPILFGLKLGGIGKAPVGGLRSLYNIYTGFVLLTTIFLFGTVLAVFRSGMDIDASFLMLISLAAWNVQACFSAFYSVYIFRRDHFRAVLNLAISGNIVGLIRQRLTRLKNIAHIGAVLCYMYTVSSLALVFIMCFPSVTNLPPATICATFSWYSARILIVLATPFANIAWSFVSFLYFYLGIVAAYAVEGLVKDIANAVTLKQTICRLSLKYYNVVKFVEYLDDGLKLKVFCAVALTLNVPVLVCQIYILVAGHDAEAFLKIQMGIWTVGQVTQIFILTSASQINQCASQLHTHLYSQYIAACGAQQHAKRHQQHILTKSPVKKNGDTVDEITYHRVHILMNQLAHTTIGFTVFDLFIINKTTILTMLSVVVTYFLLLVEFATVSNIKTNCTAV